MKALLLSVIAVASISLVLGTGYYRTWFLDKPLFYWKALIKESSSHSSLEQIRRVRYGAAYALCMAIKDTVGKRKIKDPVILFEPNGYYRDSLHLELRMPEPAVFYYYTGLRGVWTRSPDVEKANYLVRIDNGKVEMDPILSPEQLQLILARYRKFVPILL